MPRARRRRAMSQPAGPSGSILARTARGAGWVVAWRVMTRVLGVGSTLVLVRLLSPEDFGLVALATTFALALDVCLSIGVEDQIVRSRDPRRDLYDTAFTMNAARCAVVTVLILLLAEPAATFFGDARLREVLYALALSAILVCAVNIGVVDFRRSLSFEKEFKLQLLPRLLGITVTLAAAWLLRSHWALVLGILANRMGTVVASYVMHPYRPRLSLRAWRELVGVSFWSWAISMVSVVRDRADALVVGRMLGPAPLGVYSVSVEVATLPTSEVISPICRACMPGFAETLRGGDTSQLRHSYLRIIALMALLTLPAGVGTSLIAGPLVALAFGPGWTEAAPLISVIAIAGMLSLCGNVSGALLVARAALRTVFGINLASALLRVALLLLLVPMHGLLGAAIAIGIVVVLDQLAFVAAVLRMLDLRPMRLLLAMHRPLLATGAMALAVWGAGLGWNAPPASAGAALPLLLQGLALGVASYALALLALWVAAGRPAGAEADVLTLLRRAAARILPARPGLSGAD
jgi:lipopolysaccharide exporter